MLHTLGSTMPDTTGQNAFPTGLKRIKRIGKVGRGIALAGVALVASVTLWGWSDTMLIEGAARTHLGLKEGSIALTTQIVFLTFVFSLIPAGLLIYGMGKVAQLFHSFATGRVFAVENADYVSQLGWTFIAAGLANSPLRALVGFFWGLTLPGYRSLTLAFGMETLVFMLVGAGLLAIAVVLREAVRLHHENQQFV
jgi:hypothetical protein